MLYECLTGKRAFEGEDVSDTLASILAREPEFEALPTTLDPRILDLLERRLEKDARNRWHDIADVRVDIEKILASPIGVVAHGHGKAQPTWRSALALALAVGVIGAFATWFLRSVPNPRPVSRLLITVPPGEKLTSVHFESPIAMSPDGGRIAYSATVNGVFQIFLRRLDSLKARPISGTESVNSVVPFFAPNGLWLGFVDGAGIYKIPIDGGERQVVCECLANVRGVSWGPDDTIVFAGPFVAGTTGSREGLFRVSAAGGELETLAQVDREKGERQYRQPEVLPGGQALLFTVHRDDGSFQIAVLSLETGKRKVVLEGARVAHYAPTGHLVYATAVGGTLMAAPFDLAGLEVTGDPVPILEKVRSVADAAVDYAFSDDGTLVYVPAVGGGEGLVTPSVPVWVDRSGREGEAIVEEPLEFPRYPRLSPDGQRLALTTGPGSRGDLWVYDLGGRPPFPLTFEGHNANGPWTPDGKRVAFASTQDGPRNLFWMPADGSTLDPEPLLTSPSAQVPRSWTPDGRELIFLQTNPEQQNNLMALPIEGEREPRLVVETQYPYSTADHGAGAALSPDGRWLAYMSGVTGSPEIWVRPYPGSGVPFRISPSGGREPVWGSGGQELFYLEGNKMMAVTVAPGPGLTSEPPQVLFEGNYLQTNRPSYDVGSDGRFLMIKAADEEEGQPGQIIVVLNWSEELKRLVPTP